MTLRGPSLSARSPPGIWQIGRNGAAAKSIASMTEYAMKQYGATKAYVTGLSAGAAMTSVMLATYPDLFEAGAIMAGLPYACATSQTDAYTCMSPGRDKSPAAWADLVPKVTGASPPRVSIWHGDADWIVRPANETQRVRQWTGVAGVAGAYLLDEGLCSTTKAAVFFGLIAGDGTPTPGATNPPGTSSSGGSSSGSSGQAGACP